MSDNVDNIATPNNKRKLPLLPYVWDFIKYTGGFTAIIIIALIVIHVVSSKFV